MEVFRVSIEKFAREMDGEGARLFGGRWNLKGIPCIYASESRALAVLEYSVNTSLDLIPPFLCIVCFEIPDRNIRRLSVPDLPWNWQNTAIPISTREFGTSILLDGKTLAFRVPSAIIPEEFNFVINPLQYDPDGLRIKDVQDFPYDARIKK
jgi:RES domain-containing protein